MSTARPEDQPLTVGGAARFEVPAMPCSWSDHFLPRSHVQSDACAVLALADRHRVDWWGMLVSIAWQILDGEQQAAAEALVAGEFPRMETFFVMREVIMRHAHHVIVNGRREQPPWP